MQGQNRSRRGLTPGTRAREYLLGRGFKKETLEKIRAGAARDSWDDLLGALSALSLRRLLYLKKAHGFGPCRGYAGLNGSPHPV